MDFEAKFKNIAIIGAAGKMGSGISVLITNLVANLMLSSEDKSSYKIHLVDISDKALTGLMQYLRVQLRKLAEKNINALRTVYKERADLVENGEMIDEFINSALSIARPCSVLESVKDADYIFEAAIEDLELKTAIFTKLDTLCKQNTLFFTNTSSIPISELEKIGNLKGRVVGVHFYNPPPVQKLVEVITTEHTSEEAKNIVHEVGKRLRKKLTPSNDIAGFIGNGHFIRDGLYAISEIIRLEKELGFAGALYAMNKVSQDFLVRPMGIFQLIDYVGIDVFGLILKVMDTYIDEPLKSDLIEEYLAHNIKGGQFSNGTQKDGFFKYEKNKPVGLYNIREKKYVLFCENELSKQIDEKLGEMPKTYIPWKKLLSDGKKAEKLATYFKELKAMETLGAKLAVVYLEKSKDIANYLKESGVTDDVENVNKVLMNGFYHIYGAVNQYI